MTSIFTRLSKKREEHSEYSALQISQKIILRFKSRALFDGLPIEGEPIILAQIET